MSGWSKGILIGLGVVAIAVVTLPWWLGAAGRPVLRRYGVEFEEYERLGYRSFVLRGVRYARGSVEVTAREVHGVTPILWGTGLLAEKAPEIRATGWRVRVVPAKGPGTTPPARASTVRGMPSLHAQLNRVVDRLQRFLPAAAAEKGVVEIRGRSIEVPHAAWQNGRLTLTNAAFRGQVGDLDLARDDARDFTLSAKIPASDTSASGRWNANDVSGEGTFWGEPWSMDSRFPDEGWIPENATLLAENWDLPAERVRLENGYSRVRGDARLSWSGKNFEARVSASATPSSPGKAPPLKAQAEARGDRDEIIISALQIESAFAQLSLTGPVVLGFDGTLRSEPAALVVSGDFKHVPWFEAEGTVKGRLTFDGRGGSAHGAFDLAASDFVFREFRAQQAQLRGTWRAPEIQVDEAVVTVDEQSSATVRGSWNWRTQEIAGATGEGQVAANSLRQWLPANVTWKTASIKAEASGPVRALRHAGSVKGDGFKAGITQTLGIAGQWQGIHTNVEQISVEATSGKAALSSVFAVDRARVEIRELSLHRDKDELLRLRAPASVQWRPHLAVNDLMLEGTERHLEIDASAAPGASVRVDAAGVDDALFRDWFELPGPEWGVHQLELTGKNEEHALVFELSTETTLQLRDQRAHVRLHASGDDHGIALKEVAIAQGDQMLTRASGRIPGTVSLAPTVGFALKHDAPLALKAEVSAQSALWQIVSEFTGVKIENASASANLEGTLDDPKGTLRVAAGAIDAAGTKLAGKMPAITDIDFTARAATDAITVDRLTAKLAGQPLQASVRLPLEEDAWEKLRKAPKEFDWRAVQGKITTGDVELGELARSFALLPLTKGRLNASVAIDAGKLSGDLRFFNASSRPIPGMGVLQNVHADVSLKDRTLTIASFRGELGSEPVEMSGSATLADRNELKLALGLKGKNLPLVRRPGLLVRTDLDLRANTDARGITSIKGRVDLRDTLVLADLAAILPGGPRGAGRQPPYFSVSVAPYSEWPIDIDVRGRRAVRVRTAVFNGTASANFDLTGTLGEPRAIGQLAVDEGRVLFPFATFDVQNGSVRLSEADPHRPQLSVNAMARRHGYELRLEAGGTLASPVITLSSNPPLEAAEVLLMVTTGQPPANDSATTTNQQRLTQLGAYVGKGLLQNFGVGDGESRLEISSGEEVSRQGRETYQLEYRLSERWAFTGEYDEFDEYNAGVKWRVYEQKGDRDEKKK